MPEGHTVHRIAGQFRERFVGQEIRVSSFADLRGPTACELLDGSQVEHHRSNAGPDPLAPDRGGKEMLRFIERVIKAKTPIGQLLMNQDVISGIGNVYRAELLFRAEIDPHRPGSSLQASQVEGIWHDAVKLLKVGVAKGIMITRDEYLAKNPNFDDRYFVYKREGLSCRNCGAKVALEIMATRKLYWCPSCQK